MTHATHAVPLGTPLPCAESPTSVSLPRWADVVGYEESVPSVVSALRGGYPRFVWPEPLVKLNRLLNAKHGDPVTEILALPSHRSAERCARLMSRWTKQSIPVIRDDKLDVSAVRFPAELQEQARWFIQHVGEMVSARAADALLARRQTDDADGKRAKTALRIRLAELEGVCPDQVFLFPTGMAAIAAVHRTLLAPYPDAQTIQFGFPYVDLLKLQQRAGHGVVFFPEGSSEELPSLKKAAQTGRCRGVFCELPTNPLLRVPPLQDLAAILAQAMVPCIVDATIAGPGTTELRGIADVAVYSLTKFFSGAGDVMGGAVILREDGPLRGRCWREWSSEYEDLLYSEDAIALERNSRDYTSRIKRIGETTLHVIRSLEDAALPVRIFHPSVDPSNAWNMCSKPGAPHCGLFSLEFLGGAPAARCFYDSLECLKGPGFGYHRTIASPAVLLAHYRELDWAASCGVASHLIRISIGLEDPRVLSEVILAAAAKAASRQPETAPRLRSSVGS